MASDPAQDYEEFIKITRQHQAKRERQKKSDLKKAPREEYYIDISQVDTLVVDNLVEAPERTDNESKLQKREAELIKLYCGQGAYEHIRSIEMYIDEQFRKKCHELKPHYWPVIPINAKPYLNPR